MDWKLSHPKKQLFIINHAKKVRKMKSKKTLTLVILVVAALLGAAFYFLYWIRTPAYALNQTRLAIKEHNTAKFEQYVDLNSVLDNAFEDIIKAESKINNDNLFSNPFALGILHMLKPSVVDLMKQEALDKIAAKPAQEEKAVDPVHPYRSGLSVPERPAGHGRGALPQRLRQRRYRPH